MVPSGHLFDMDVDDEELRSPLKFMSVQIFSNVEYIVPGGHFPLPLGLLVVVELDNPWKFMSVQILSSVEYIVPGGHFPPVGLAVVAEVELELDKPWKFMSVQILSKVE